MKPSFRNIYAFAAVLSLTACVNDDTDFGDVIIDSQFEPVAIAFSNEPAADAEETIPAGDNDYVENNTFAYTVTITYDRNRTVKKYSNWLNGTFEQWNKNSSWMVSLSSLGR